MALTFKDPAPNPRSGGVASAAHLRAAAELRARTGQWAILTTVATASRASGLAKRVKSGRVIAFSPSGEFDACYRHDDGKYVVYAKHLGAPVTAAEPKPRAKVAARSIGATPARGRKAASA